MRRFIICYTVPYMQFSEYQKESRVTALYPDVGNNFVYPTLGLVGEAGEIAEKVKKLIRDKQIDSPRAVSEIDKAEIAKELGDVLWYLAQVASEFGLTLDDVATGNIEKLRSRQMRGNLHGDGDNR
jgi:NTP pyrophosphatase (non-canonical NTP hydrolase)